MKRWAALVVALYMAVLAALAIPLVLVAFVGEWSWSDLVEMGGGWVTATSATQGRGSGVIVVSAFLLGWILLMGLLQVCLLVVPVRLEGWRPVKKRHVVWPILASFIALTLLGIGVAFCLNEVCHGMKALQGSWEVIVAGAVIFWVAWAFVFGFYVGGRDPRTLMQRLVRGLVAGSILEMLVAVPVHVIARSKQYCCAGFSSFIGLALGTSLILLAFGPAVFVLIVRRWQSIRSPRQVPPPPQHEAPQLARDPLESK